MMGAAQYARAVVAHGTVGIYWDPHEVANVVGLQGVKEMVKDVRRTPLKAMVTTPSCVPAVPGFEDTGSRIDADDVAETMAWDCVVGLGEMMNFPGVLAGADQPLEEIAATLKSDGMRDRPLFRPGNRPRPQRLYLQRSPLLPRVDPPRRRAR